jgi:hypothetical protein
MKIKFKFIGARNEVSSMAERHYGVMPVDNPNKTIIDFVSVNGDINISITVDERNQLAAHLANQMQNEIFEFDFGQEIPKNRLNSNPVKL